MEIERDVGLRAWEIYSDDGVESKVFYDTIPDYSDIPDSCEFIVISVMDVDIRVNKLVVSDTFLRRLGLEKK